MSSLTYPFELVNIELVYATKAAFAAKRYDGKVVAWGNCYYGGCLPNNPFVRRIMPESDGSIRLPILPNVGYIVATPYVFVAFTTHKEMIPWGHPMFGGNATGVLQSSAYLRSGIVKYVRYTNGAMAILTEKGGVFCWGLARYGGDVELVKDHVEQDIIRLYSNDYAFAAMNRAGDVIVWGDHESGGSFPMNKQVLPGANFTVIYATRSAFAGLFVNGSVFVWGNSEEGGRLPTSVATIATSSSIIIKEIKSNHVAFVARRQKSVSQDEWIAWGNALVVKNAGTIRF